MRPQRQNFRKPVMTKAQNRVAYEMWLAGAATDALKRVDPGTIGRCYGVDEALVRSDIASQLQQREGARVAELTVAPRGREQLEEQVACCEKRAARAEERLASAQTESRDAFAALASAQFALAAWIKANPDPQMAMFE